MSSAIRLVLMGPPGCGKGTQGKKLEAKYRTPQLSTGDILRQAVRDRTPIGIKAKGYMDGGNLVPDAVMIDIIRERIAASDCENGYILDGFPRTIAQAEALDGLFAKRGERLLAAVNLDVPDEEVVARLSGRRQCKECGTGYHVEFNKSKRDGICDACGGPLYQRDDDNEATVRSRLNVYKEKTAPLLDYYRKKNLLSNVPGTGSIDDIFGRICSLIDGKAGAKAS